ncbi:transcriptional regulator [Paenibacillus sp. 598K]|uniref:helix-turn-helix domain-containing protein n=1 Tax=Paenibacillus sp. 598K TaxID=1117987 RepID=UPI000FF9515E|nr:helix-turn-helix transcriptional regulator [Paenibacillus sp. 598K]GBF78495.1 transcriptional regulator [Paenibacillus sp. 598K]
MIYNKEKVGKRIRQQRDALGISRERMAEHIGRVPRFCGDIERGKVGMSIETLLSICDLLKLTPNDLLIDSDEDTPKNETGLVLAALANCTDKQRQDAVALLKLFLKAIK